MNIVVFFLLNAVIPFKLKIRFCTWMDEHECRRFSLYFLLIAVSSSIQKVSNIIRGKTKINVVVFVFFFPMYVIFKYGKI